MKSQSRSGGRDRGAVNAQRRPNYKGLGARGGLPQNAAKTESNKIFLSAAAIEVMTFG